MKKAKILTIDKKPEFRTNDGNTLYVFELELDNGDKGAIFKQKDNPYVEVGDSISYELTERGTIKIQREGGGFTPKQSFKKDDNVQEYIIKQSSLKCAVDICIAQGLYSPEDILSRAEAFTNWVMNKNQVSGLNFVDDKAPF